MGLLSHGQLAFDPLKPIILRGLPTEDGSTLFAGKLVLSLTKPTKVSRITVALKSQITTYWPEGIGIRGTRLTHEKMLDEKRIEIMLSENKQEAFLLQTGEHRFTFAFIIPNSTVTSLEDTFGRVKHTVEALVQRPGIVLSNWTISKPVTILRTYMSNSLLTNNSLATLSKTFEKREAWGDIEVEIEAAAFSPGEIFYIRLIIQPKLKHVRIEHIELNCIESRKYSVPEMQAWRNDTECLSMPFAGSFRLSEFGEVIDTTKELSLAFGKRPKGLDLEHDFIQRLAFATPTCSQGIRHTTYVREIMMKHHIELKISLSYLEKGRHQTTEKIITPPPQAYLSNHRSTSIPVNQSFEDCHIPSKDYRKVTSMVFDTSITVFDCRLKEDYGQLPSYFELGVKPTEMNQSKKNVSTVQSLTEPNRPRPYFCPCYYKFCSQVELATQSLFEPQIFFPSIPPPDYSA
ncbi:hypothetical protein BY458DRAFT_497758 [Sporodiniella umbellata]|nr:hypothetical protein BY458DRAFT_497758 [Sporodiniella umbellata]